MPIAQVIEFFVLIGSLGFAVALYYTYKLSQETGNERYWFSFLIAALSLGIHQWIKIPWNLSLFGLDTTYLVINGLGEILGSVAFAYASYGLYTTMKTVHEKMGE